MPLLPTLLCYFTGYGRCDAVLSNNLLILQHVPISCKIRPSQRALNQISIVYCVMSTTVRRLGYETIANTWIFA